MAVSKLIIGWNRIWTLVYVSLVMAIVFFLLKMKIEKSKNFKNIWESAYLS